MARAIWLDFRFNLSLREVEEMMLERGVVVSYDTIHRWCRLHVALLAPQAAFGQRCWHLDEVVVRIGGRKCWLWRAVDQDGYVLDEIVQTRRNTVSPTFHFRVTRRFLRLKRSSNFGLKYCVQQWTAEWSRSIPRLAIISFKSRNLRL
ncbi:IS6 family transposase [Ochrobactrum cytisi]|nr:IS6 family transposase [Brucella cytisi]